MVINPKNKVYFNLLIHHIPITSRTIIMTKKEVSSTNHFLLLMSNTCFIVYEYKNNKRLIYYSNKKTYNLNYKIHIEWCEDLRKKSY